MQNDELKEGDFTPIYSMTALSFPSGRLRIRKAGALLVKAHGLSSADDTNAICVINPRRGEQHQAKASILSKESIEFTGNLTIQQCEPSAFFCVCFLYPAIQASDQPPVGFW